MRDVILIGGGPAGLRLAQKLAQAGFDCALYDDRSEVGAHKICTGIISAEAFDKLDLPRQSIVNKIQRLKFLSPQGAELDYLHPSLLAYVVDRSGFDRSLCGLAESAGACVYNETRVESIRLEQDHVAVEVAPVVERAARQTIRARLVVIATGVNFRLNKSVGLGVPTEFLSAAQAHLRISSLECTHCFAGQGVAPGAFGWLVPIHEGWARVGLMTLGRAASYFQKLLSRISACGLACKQDVEVDYKPIAQGFRGRSFGHRVIAVGEAAGQVKTTTGGGIYYGLLGADVAADVLTGALHEDRCSADFLSLYERAWKDRIAREVDTGLFFRKLFSRLSDRQIEGLFHLARINGIVPLIKRTAQFDWHSDLLHSVAKYPVLKKIVGNDLAGVAD